MRKKMHLAATLVALILAIASCDVHEWPTPGGSAPAILLLEFDTGMVKVEHPYLAKSTSERTYYQVRHSVRVFTVNEKGESTGEATTGIVVTAPWTGKPDQEIPLQLPAGKSKITVWTDVVPVGTRGDHHYNTTDFSAITLNTPHAGNTDTRDAFRGVVETSVTTSIAEDTAREIVVPMQRPLAKFTFISTDIKEFVDKEYLAAKAKAEAKARAKAVEAGTASDSLLLEDDPSKVSKIDINDYRVVFRYAGFMPHVFDIFRDKPVDSREPGTVSFESRVTPVNEREAAIGFDHVLVNGKESSVLVIIELYNKEAELLSVSNPVTVPVKRGQHTIIRGKFLTTESSGGVSINPGFEDEFIVPVY